MYLISSNLVVRLTFPSWLVVKLIILPFYLHLFCSLLLIFIIVNVYTYILTHEPGAARFVFKIIIIIIIIINIKERKNILKMNKEVGMLLLKKELIQVE